MISRLGLGCILVPCLLGVPLSNANEVVCDKGIDLMFLQDTSGSFQDDMVNMRDQLPSMIERVKELFPNSRTGVAEFRDKPYFPLGETNDFCYKVKKGELSYEANNTEYAYSILRPSGGADLAEDPYQAIINVLQDSRLKWRPLQNHTDPGQRTLEEENNGFVQSLLNNIYNAVIGKDDVIARVLVIITDAVPHKPGDHLKYPPNPNQPTWIVPQDLKPNSGTFNSSLNEDISCLYEDYASDDLVAKIVRDYGATVLIMHTEDVSDVWSRINSQVFKQPSNYRQIVDEQSSTITEVVTTALKALATNQCGFKDSTRVEEAQPPVLQSNNSIEENKTGELLSVDAVSESGTSSTMPPAKRKCCSKKCRRCRKCKRKPLMYIKIGDKPKHLQLEFDK